MNVTGILAVDRVAFNLQSRTVPPAAAASAYQQIAAAMRTPSAEQAEQVEQGDQAGPDGGPAKPKGAAAPVAPAASRAVKIVV